MNQPQIPAPARLQRQASIYTLTYAIIGINVLVFLAMVASGVSPTNPSAKSVLLWGADFGPLTIGQHQYWRLFTSTFLHFGIIHIGLNMYVLYQIGPFIQLVFGRLRYIAIYLSAGLVGSLTSIVIHPMSVGAGASGAIFGLYGAVFGFLLIRRSSLDPAASKNIANSAGVFVLYNVVYGSMSGTTDLAAHFGGLVGGFLAGILLAPPSPAGQRPQS